MWDVLCSVMPSVEQAAGGSFWDAGTLGGGGLAAVLAAVWLFTRVIRRIVGLLFMVCVVFLVAKTCFGLDLSGVATYVFSLFGAVPQAS